MKNRSIREDISKVIIGSTFIKFISGSDDYDFYIKKFQSLTD